MERWGYDDAYTHSYTAMIRPDEQDMYAREGLCKRVLFFLLYHAPGRYSSFLVAIPATFLQEYGQSTSWYQVILIFCIYLLGFFVLTWLIGEIVMTLIGIIIDWWAIITENL